MTKGERSMTVRPAAAEGYGILNSSGSSKEAGGGSRSWTGGGGGEGGNKVGL
jgi:hypothetical protein